MLVAVAAAAVLGARAVELEESVASNEPALSEGAAEEEMGRELLLRGGAGEAEAADEAGARELVSVGGVPGSMVFVRNTDGTVTVTWTLAGAKWMSVGLGDQMTGSRVVIGGKDTKPTSYRVTGKTSSSFTKDTTNPLTAATFANKNPTSKLTFKSKGIANLKFSVDGTADKIVWATSSGVWPQMHTQWGSGTVTLGVHCGSLTTVQCASHPSKCKVKMNKCVPK